MSHKISAVHVQKHTRGISDSKRELVSNLQNHIQEILGDTHHTFLQGSYKNDTSTSDINDVDIVAVRKNTYSGIFSSVSRPQSIYWDSIFKEIEEKLSSQKKYTWKMTRGDKCITVQTSSFKADIVPAVQIGEDVTQDPIAIFSFKSGLEKINSPRTHYRNGVAKNQSTNGNYKPVVRMFKNWVANHLVKSDVVSSYQIESLVHSVPNESFYDDHVGAFLLAADHVTEQLSKRDLVAFSIKSVCGTEDITANWNFVARQNFNSKLKESLRHGLSAFGANTIQDADRHWNQAFNI